MNHQRNLNRKPSCARQLLRSRREAPNTIKIILRNVLDLITNRVNPAPDTVVRVVNEIIMRDHHLVGQVDAPATSDLRVSIQAETTARTLPHRTNSPAEIMVVTSGLHTVDQVVAAMNTQDHRLADQAADVANLPRHRADLVADGVHKLDGCLMGLMGNPEDDLAISDLLANEVAEIVVQTLGHHPADPVVYEVIMTVHPDVDRMVMIAANQVVIATRDPSDHLDETHKGRIY